MQMMLRHVTMRFDDVNGGFDGNEYAGAVRDSVDGSGSADDASELEVRETTQLKVRI